MRCCPSRVSPPRENPLLLQLDVPCAGRMSGLRMHGGGPGPARNRAHPPKHGGTGTWQPGAHPGRGPSSASGLAHLGAAGHSKKTGRASMLHPASGCGLASGAAPFGATPHGMGPREPAAAVHPSSGHDPSGQASGCETATAFAGRVWCSGYGAPHLGGESRHESQASGLRPIFRCGPAPGAVPMGTAPHRMGPCEPAAAVHPSSGRNSSGLACGNHIHFRVRRPGLVLRLGSATPRR